MNEQKRRSRVVLVEDQTMFREGIRRRLQQEDDIEVVGEAGSAEEALAVLEETLPDIVLLDIRMPHVSGVELAGIIRKRWPKLSILVLTGYDFDQYIRALTRVGIQGYMVKEESADLLVDAIREIAEGRAYLPPRIASKVLREFSGPRRDMGAFQVSELTIREIEIVELVYEGLRNSVIAERLGVSTRTVENHVASIMSKLGVKSRTEIVRVALERGLIR